MKIPFTKAHGAGNDFVLTWREHAPSHLDFAAVAQAICDRHTGVGADGWLLVSGGGSDYEGAIELWNSDGSPSEISGNGTRCAAAFLIEAGRGNDNIRIATGAGVKHLRLLGRGGRTFSFEMNMGKASVEDLRATLEMSEGDVLDAAIVNVGNPQCAVFVQSFDFDWRTLGAAIERHPRFPNRTNVSFIRVIDKQRLDVRFFERGAGETMSSGTGSTGAAAAAVARGLARSPLQVVTPAGPLDLRWEGEDILLTGPAEIVASGEFYFD
jgi:diaminopimelate epimerase